MILCDQHIKFTQTNTVKQLFQHTKETMTRFKITGPFGGHLPEKILVRPILIQLPSSLLHNVGIRLNFQKNITLGTLSDTQFAVIRVICRKMTKIYPFSRMIFFKGISE